MSKRWAGPAVFLVLVAAVAGTAWWLSRPAAAGRTPPKGAPAVGSCWNVPENVAATPFPWPGKAVGCGAAHTVEVFKVGQVAQELVTKAAQAKGTEAKVVEQLMSAEARRDCLTGAAGYL